MDLFINMIFNISLLILIAVIITRIPAIRKFLYNDKDINLSSQIILAIIFGLFCIFSTSIGQKVDGAIQNTRVIGALAGGLYGGPIVGMGAAVIGSLHRYFYDPTGFTTIACSFSTMFEGVLGSFIWYLFRRFNRRQNAVSLFLITAAAEICQMLFILLISRPFDDAWDLVKIIALPMIFVNSLGMILFFDIFEHIYIDQKKKEEQDMLTKAAELKALQSQINPHFLFNALGTISCFCREKPDKARELLIALSVYFRNTLKSTEETFIPLSSEMNMINSYLMLEKARFEEKLFITIDMPEISDFYIPPMIIQPIVENAVVHGASKMEHGQVTIKGYIDERGLNVSISDNGPGFEPYALKEFLDHTFKGHYGMNNVDQRLKGLYGHSHGLKIDSSDVGTTVSFTLSHV